MNGKNDPKEPARGEHAYDRGQTQTQRDEQAVRDSAKADPMRRTSPAATIGRIVDYRLSPEEVREINQIPQTNLTGQVKEGDCFPMIIVRVGGTLGDGVNGQVFLDGARTYWVSGKKQGDNAGSWSWPVKV